MEAAQRTTQAGTRRAARQVDGRRTTVTLSPEVDEVVELLMAAEGLSRNAALQRLAALGAERYRREHERLQISARRREIVDRLTPPVDLDGPFPTDAGLDAAFPTDAEMAEVGRLFREE